MANPTSHFLCLPPTDAGANTWVFPASPTASSGQVIMLWPMQCTWRSLVKCILARGKNTKRNLFALLYLAQRHNT